MAKHVNVSDVVEGVAAILSKANLFAEVRVAAVSGYENLFALIPDMASFPTAVIAAGSMTFANQGVTRELDLAIIVIDEFRSDPREALAELSLIDSAIAAMLPPVPETALRVGYSNVTLLGCEPMALDSTHCAWIITFNSQSSI